MTDEERRAKARESRRRDYQKNREENREKARIYRAENRELIRDRRRLRSERDRAQRNHYRLRKNHGLREEQVAAEIAAQDGKCCYCHRPLAGDVNIEHDHDHCPRPTSCRICRRGISCQPCNLILGHAADDVDLLLTIAANARPIIAAARQRIAAASRPLTLFDDLEAS